MKTNILISLATLFLLTSLILAPYPSKYYALKAEVRVANEVTEKLKKEKDRAVKDLVVRGKLIETLEKKNKKLIDGYRPDYPDVGLQFPTQEVGGDSGNNNSKGNTRNNRDGASFCGPLLKEAYRSYERVLREFEEDARTASAINNAYRSCRSLIIE